MTFNFPVSWLAKDDQHERVSNPGLLAMSDCLRRGLIESAGLPASSWVRVPISKVGDSPAALRVLQANLLILPFPIRLKAVGVVLRPGARAELVDNM